mmetsp:Transcript_21458/g.36850  ORF Transcript_21458/g.36850 Transcript_21458/m.36850 type:complete len:169 (-) Transcript_21458:189-695(-)|eukprot:CAMPEP_0183730020 /NCGR_PEP_ID=MMETSP0737-20130205/31813_1 /TAXON_ID=385413 /ORGANISM="Thalassiosira miniscula, Strain CCMP1093" /LENGTH=168 /DNA_ID=CAMNT_0025962385 /DNA_START=205 /DNA_END=711 /DNA_ORIENTATION=-
MCANPSAAGDEISNQSSILGTIDRLVEALDKAEGQDEKGRDPFDVPSSSVALAYTSFGIRDSLTLVRGKIRVNGSGERYDMEVDLEGNKMTWDEEDEENDYSEAARKEFATSLTHDGSVRRSGVRRGYPQESFHHTKVIKVATKTHDGNHNPDTRLRVSMDKDKAVQK